MGEIERDELLKLKRKVFKAKLLGLPLPLSEEEKEAIKEWEISEKVKEDEILKRKKEEIAKSLSSLMDNHLPLRIGAQDWVEDIIRKEEQERFEYIEKNLEFIEQKILNRTPTPPLITIRPFGYYPLNVSLDIIIHVHNKMLETDTCSVYSTFKVDGALLYLVTDSLYYHITLLFYNDDKANLFYQNRWLSRFKCHPSNYAPITTINFDKKEVDTPSSYLSCILESIFHISPYQVIETTFKRINIK